MVSFKTLLEDAGAGESPPLVAFPTTWDCSLTVFWLLLAVLVLVDWELLLVVWLLLLEDVEFNGVATLVEVLLLLEEVALDWRV